MRRGNKELVDDRQKIEKTQASVSTKSVNFKAIPPDVLMDDDKAETLDDISDTDSQESTYGNSQDTLISNRKRQRRINDEVVELFESVDENDIDENIFKEHFCANDHLRDDAFEQRDFQLPKEFTHMKLEKVRQNEILSRIKNENFNQSSDYQSAISSATEAFASEID